MSLEALHDMSDTTTVGELIAAFLEQCGVRTAFGVISIHNMPILDAIGRRGNIRYVGARGEAGALNMADGLARVSGGLGVAFTQTGTAAGNAAGAMVEALTAGTALLHVTGQIETEYLDQDLAYIHEAPGPTVDAVVDLEGRVPRAFGRKPRCRRSAKPCASRRPRRAVR